MCVWRWGAQVTCPILGALDGRSAQILSWGKTSICSLTETQSTSRQNGARARIPEVKPSSCEILSRVWVWALNWLHDSRCVPGPRSWPKASEEASINGSLGVCRSGCHHMVFSTQAPTVQGRNTPWNPWKLLFSIFSVRC